jgi:hypothetical protein
MARVAANTKKAEAELEEIRERQRVVNERLIGTYRGVLEYLDPDSPEAGGEVERRHFEAMVFYYPAEELRTGDIADIVRDLIAEGWTITAEELAALSPYLSAYVSRFGAYATDVLGIEPEAFNSVLDEIDFTVMDLAD